MGMRARNRQALEVALRDRSTRLATKLNASSQQKSIIHHPNSKASCTIPTAKHQTQSIAISTAKHHASVILSNFSCNVGRDARAQHIRRQRMTAHQTRARQGSSKAASSARASPAARRRARQKVPSSRAPQLSAMPSPSCSPLTPVVQLAAEGAAARGEVAPPPA
eukprot:scaffold24402_cov16-Tisochrysis_lutea.AAC.1